MLRPCGNFKKSYEEDESIFPTTFLKLSIFGFLVFLLILPLVSSKYALNFINITGIFIIGAIGLNIVTGFTGLISLGHAVFMGLGAYATVLLMTKLNLSFFIAFPLGALIAAFLALIPGFTCLRIKGFYLAISTLAAQIIFEFAIVETPGFTGGDLGLAVPVPKVFSTLNTYGQELLYYFIFAIVIGSTMFARNLFRTKPGRLFVAIRDNDLSCKVLGISVGKYKLISFWLGSFYAGLAGGLWAICLGTISPEQFSLALSLQFLFIILVGGMGSILGSILGTVFVLLIPEVMANISTAARGAAGFDLSKYLVTINNGIFGLLIIIFLIYEPHGLAKIWWKIKNYWKLWPFSYSD
jgi:branched-chain amino acid transport system permease protein